MQRKKYECLYETLDWNGDKARLRRDRAFLKTIPGITFQKYVIEDGDPMEGYGAGLLVRIPIVGYEDANRLCCAHQESFYGRGGLISRYGLAIIEEI